MTYRQLLSKMLTFTKEQLDSDVTIEMGIFNECFAANLRICGSEHESLDENHPVIYTSDA